MDLTLQCNSQTLLVWLWLLFLGTFMAQYLVFSTFRGGFP